MAPPRRPEISVPLAQALARSAPLGALLQRVRDSEARWAVVRPLLPPPLAGQVRPGPLDDASWTLLVASGPAAAKLRQCLPTAEAALQAHGLPPRQLRVKVQPAR